jgi:hypothetical protein
LRGVGVHLHGLSIQKKRHIHESALPRYQGSQWRGVDAA